MFIGYDGETSGGNDPTKTTGSHEPREWSLGKPVRLSKTGPQLTPSRQWWTSPLKQEEELVSVGDSAR